MMLTMGQNVTKALIALALIYFAIITFFPYTYEDCVLDHSQGASVDVSVIDAFCWERYATAKQRAEREERVRLEKAERESSAQLEAAIYEAKEREKLIKDTAQSQAYANSLPFDHPSKEYLNSRNKERINEFNADEINLYLNVFGMATNIIRAKAYNKRKAEELEDERYRRMMGR
ncbi:MAG: hypothetical protein HY804_07005 [Nitrospinae bacterium]|nr:hypothetical protein [Nitrospinota bacterium]